MADDFLKQLESLHEDELEENYEQLIEEVQLLLAASNASVQADLISSFLKKVACHGTESKILSFYKVTLPAAETACNQIFKNLQGWQDISQVSKLLQVLFCFS